MLLELLVPGDWDTARRNFERLMQSVDTGGISLGLRVGTGSATWTAASTSANATIPHGLDRAPVFVGLTSRNDNIAYERVSADATNIVVRGFHTPGTAPGALTLTFEWLVIG